MLTAYIIDDEKQSRLKLKSLLKTHCPEIKVLEEADTYEKGKALISKKNVDVVFLDVELGDKTGVQMLSELGKVNSYVIFVTAYSSYASSAFRHDAIDYLLKPIDSDHLVQSVKRVKEQKKKDQLFKMQIAENSPSYGFEFHVNNQKQRLKINSEEVMFIAGHGSYSLIQFVNNDKFLASKGLKKFDFLCEKASFYRVHQSFLANFNYMKAIQTTKECCLIADNDMEVKISRRKLPEVKAFFDNFRRNNI